jgi:hypothetical protein
MKRVFALAALGTALITPSAHAASLSGLTTLTPGGKASSALKQQKVKLSVKAPAELASDGRILLPASEGTFGSKTTTVRQGGSIVFSRKSGGKTRKATLSSWRVELGKKSSFTAKLGGKRIQVLSLDLRTKEYTADAKSSVVKVVATRASLTAAAASALGKKLGTTKLKAGEFAVITSSAAPPVAGGAAPGTVPGGTTTPGTGGPTTPGTGGTPTCSTAPSATTTPPSAPLARPATAVDVTSSSLLWHVRESFVQYLASGEGATAADGATPGAPVALPGKPPLVYDFNLVPAGGWYDAASGKARLTYAGTVKFTYSGHGIAFEARNLEVEINGSDSQVLATFAACSATAFRGRAVLATLNLAGATGGVSGTTHTFTETPGAVPTAATDTVFAGFYSAGDPFGWFSISFTSAS